MPREALLFLKIREGKNLVFLSCAVFGSMSSGMARETTKPSAIGCRRRRRRGRPGKALLFLKIREGRNLVFLQQTVLGRMAP